MPDSFCCSYQIRWCRIAPCFGYIPFIKQNVSYGGFCPAIGDILYFAYKNQLKRFNPKPKASD